jgi:hypothetical protein
MALPLIKSRALRAIAATSFALVLCAASSATASASTSEIWIKATSGTAATQTFTKKARKNDPIALKVETPTSFTFGVPTPVNITLTYDANQKIVFKGQSARKAKRAFQVFKGKSLFVGPWDPLREGNTTYFVAGVGTGKPDLQTAALTSPFAANQTFTLAPGQSLTATLLVNFNNCTGWPAAGRGIDMGYAITPASDLAKIFGFKTVPANYPCLPSGLYAAFGARLNARYRGQSVSLNLSRRFILDDVRIDGATPVDKSVPLPAK